MADDAGGGLSGAIVPLELNPLEAHQFDWSHELVLLAGRPIKVKAASPPAWPARPPPLEPLHLLANALDPPVQRTRRDIHVGKVSELAARSLAAAVALNIGDEAGGPRRAALARIPQIRQPALMSNCRLLSATAQPSSTPLPMPMQQPTMFPGRFRRVGSGESEAPCHQQCKPVAQTNSPKQSNAASLGCTRWIQIRNSDAGN